MGIEGLCWKKGSPWTLDAVSAEMMTGMTMTGV